MKITCESSKLLAACQTLDRATAHRTTQPVLRNLKAVAVDDTLTLTGYDPTEGVGMTYRLHCEVKRAGSAILPKDQLLKILRESSGSVEITADDKSIVVKAGGKFEMPSLDVNEFPDLPTFAAESSITLPA